MASIMIDPKDKDRICMMSTEEKGELLEAILQYHTGGKVPNLSKTPAITFSFLKPKFDKNMRISELRREAGRKGTIKREAS